MANVPQGAPPATHDYRKEVSFMQKSFKTTMIVLAILYVIIGAVLIIWPETARNIICYTLGALLVLFGVYRIMAYFIAELPLQMQFGVAIGIACILAGLLLLFKADAVVALFGVVVGVTLIVDSVLRLQTALDIRRIGGNHWAPVFICALTMLALGVLLLFNPFKAVITATIIGGVALVIEGALTIWSIIEVSKQIKTATAATESRVK